MSRKSLVLAISIVVVFGGGAGASIVLLLRYEPSFYRHAAIPPGHQREEWSKDFGANFGSKVLSPIGNEQEWREDFKEEVINSFLAEQFGPSDGAENPFPRDISDPRFSLKKDRVSLGFRYHHGAINTIVSVEMRPWLASKEPNVLVLEFLSLHAGAIPVSAQWLLDRIAESARKYDIDASYYRYDKRPVVVLRFPNYRDMPSFQLREFRSGPGFVRVSGRASEKPKS